MIVEKFGYKIEFGHGSSSGHPGYKGMQISDVRLWFKINESDWIRSDHSNSQGKILKEIEISENEMKLLFILNRLNYA